MARLKLVYLSPLDRKIEFTVFDNVAAREEQPVSASLRELADRISGTQAETKEGLPLIKAAVFGGQRSRTGSLRFDANVVRVTGIECDYDGGEVSLADAEKIMADAGITGLLYTTPSCGQPGKGHRWRLICSFQTPRQGEERAHFVARVNGLFGGIFSDESFTLSQSYYFGSADDGTPVECALVSGRRHVDEADDLDDGTIWNRRQSQEPQTQAPRKAFNNDIEQLARCLEHIPERDNREDWLRVGMAIHFETDGSAEGLVLWHQWAAGPDVQHPHPKFNPDDNERTWASFANRPERPLTGATLIDMATSHGYVRPQARPQGTGRADRLVALTAGLYLFHDGDTAYADVIVDGHRETLGIRRPAFRRWLVREFYRRERSVANAEAMQAAIGLIEAQAVYDGGAHKVFVRVGSQAGKHYLDLCDDEWRAVEIDTDGWRVVESPPCRFRREDGMLALPVPVQGGDIADLKKLVNITAETDFALVVAWLAASLRDTGPYPVLDIIGGHGSAKSSLQLVLRKIVDPNEAMSRSPPRNPHDLFISASHSHVASFDNLSSISDWLSDALCRLATGGGYATRELYTGRGEELFDTCRPIIINGVSDVVTRPDLADRTIVLSLRPIGELTFMTETDLYARFADAHPRILGALLDIVSTGLQNLPSTPTTGLPRMADFAHFAQACEPAFAKLGTFMPAYKSNRTSVVMQMLEDHIVAAALCAWLADRHPAFGDFEGSAGDVLEALNDRISDEASRAKEWPKTSKAMSRELRYLTTFLSTVGIKITPPRLSDTRHRLYSIVVTGDLSRYRTAAPEEPPQRPKRPVRR